MNCRDGEGVTHEVIRKTNLTSRRSVGFAKAYAACLRHYILVDAAVKVIYADEANPTDRPVDCLDCIAEML